jgi:hypothetical protein
VCVWGGGVETHRKIGRKEKQGIAVKSRGTCRVKSTSEIS